MEWLSNPALIAACYFIIGLFVGVNRPRARNPTPMSQVTVQGEPGKLVEIPMPGQYWEFKPTRSRGPWESAEEMIRVRILDVKDGWVRYYIGRGFSDERRELASFLYIYKKADL